jgi:hypothetical protein
VLGFAGPTSSLHYVMRMEEKLSEAKLAASSGKIQDRSVITKRTTLAAKPKAATEKPAKEVAATSDEPATTATATTKPTSTATTTTTEPPRRNSPPRRSRTANRSGYGKASHFK